MNHFPYSGYELLWLFFAYSILGWIAETAMASGKKKRLVNRGFFTGPVCFIYGFSALWMTLTMQELKSRPFFLFLGCMLIATIIEWFAGKLLERMNHRKWWDYSRIKWNYDGYVCLPYSVLWGILGTAAILYGNEAMVVVFELLPRILVRVLIWVLLFVAVVDSMVSLAAVFHLEKRVDPRMTELNNRLESATRRFGRWLMHAVEMRMVHAYPGLSRGAVKEEKQGHFAEGCGFYKLFWLFFIGSLLGDGVETIFCRLTAGYWMSRSSLVWGPFSIVWGIAIVLATVLLHKDQEKPDRYIFLVGTFLGGAYEYICSVLSELVFGRVFWDYSKIPFNLGGRINLLYCFFWGIAALVWIRVLYPILSFWIEKLPRLAGILLSWLLIVFMTANMAVSVLALVRYDGRSKGMEPRWNWERVMDENFDDGRMQQIYPNAIER